MTLNNNEMLDLKDVIPMLGTGQKLAQEMLIIEKPFCHGLNEASIAPCMGSSEPITFNTESVYMYVCICKNLLTYQ